MSQPLGQLAQAWLMAASKKAVTIRRELAARWLAIYQRELEDSLRLAAFLERGEDLGDASAQESRRARSSPLSLPGWWPQAHGRGRLLAERRGEPCQSPALARWMGVAFFSELGK